MENSFIFRKFKHKIPLHFLIESAEKNFYKSLTALKIYSQPKVAGGLFVRSKNIAST